MVDDDTRPLRRVGRDGDGPSFRAGQLWAGGLATALVAALIAVVGVVALRGIFHIPVLGPTRFGTFGSVDTWWLCGFAAAAAILATGVMHLLLLATPRPSAFFGWIVFLVTVIVALHPFTTDATLTTKIATAAIKAVIGLAIGTLISGTAGSARNRRNRAAGDHYTRSAYYDDTGYESDHYRRMRYYDD